MSGRPGKSSVSDYLRRAERHFAYLTETKRIKTPTRQAFFTDLLGCSEGICRNWFAQGIRKVYVSIIVLLEEIEEHKKRIAILEKQLEEFTKK